MGSKRILTFSYPISFYYEESETKTIFENIQTNISNNLEVIDYDSDCFLNLINEYELADYYNWKDEFIQNINLTEGLVRELCLMKCENQEFIIDFFNDKTNIPKEMKSQVFPKLVTSRVFFLLKLVF